MPAATRRPTGLIAWIFLVGLIGVFVYLAWIKPLWVGGFFVVIVILSVIETRRRRARFALLQGQRSEDGGICEFARSFDSHHVDTWVIRAVYEELHSYLRGSGVNIAIRADDDLVKGLGIDAEDLEMGIASDIASRTGRSLKNPKQNPYYDKVRTAGDLVRFFNSQPKVGAT
jgi:hypothetical protein